MTARPQVELPVVCHGMRRKGEFAVIGVIPNKIAAKPPAADWYHRDYEEVPLVLASDYAELATRLAESEALAELDDATCVAIYDAVSRSNITRDVKTPTRKAAVVRAAIAQEAERE